MGFGGISVWQLLIVLVIVLLLFGTKRLKNIGSDLGNAVKGFRGALRESEAADETPDTEHKAPGQIGRKDESDVIEGEVTSRDKERS